jgi:hypothetical protein
MADEDARAEKAYTAFRRSLNAREMPPWAEAIPEVQLAWRRAMDAADEGAGPSDNDIAVVNGFVDRLADRLLAGQLKMHDETMEFWKEAWTAPYVGVRVLFRDFFEKILSKLP